MYSDFAHDQAGIMAAEAKRVAHRDIDFGFSGLQRHKIHLQVAALVLVFQVDGGGDERFVYRFYTYN